MENGAFRIYHSPNVVNLSIDAYDGEKQCGRLWNQYTGEPLCFSTLFEALEGMEALYDRLEYPFASTRPRSFLEDGGSGAEYERDIQDGKRSELRVAEPFQSVVSHRGRNATFIIRVQYRQHSSWQGEIVWVDGSLRKCFGSVLDLLRLIDSAMERCTAENRAAPDCNRW